MKTGLFRIASRALIAVALAVAAGAAAAAELKVFSTSAFTEIWKELKPKFEARGHKLELVLEPSGALNKRIAGGEKGDVIATVSASLTQLEKSGAAIAVTKRELASSGMGVAVAKGAARPDISTPEALKKALLAARAVAYSDPAGGGASGAALAKMLKDMGIEEAINAKAKLGRGISNAEFIIKGEADLAVQQIPELMTVQGVDIVGPFPPGLQIRTGFATAVLAASANLAAARELVDFLASPETLALLKSRGFDVKN